MFKKNDSHLTPELLSERNTMADNLKKRYNKSWSKGFYENVFSNIDESIFEILYSTKMSRPNIPVNIYVSLEILKEMFGLSDEQLLDRFHFDNLFIFATGLNRIGERTISESGFYKMRSRVVNYEIDTGINLFDKIFTNINDDYLKKFEIKQKSKRIDSTLIGSNIRRLNRLKLFLEVLSSFLKQLDERALKKVPKKIQKYLAIDTERHVFSMAKDESQREIQQIAEYLYRVKRIFEKDKRINESAPYSLLKRLVEEQINVENRGKTKKITLKDSKELTSSCLQSPYDPEATYRKKGNQARHGYSVSVAETCDPDNKLQIITDVIVEKNNIDDSKILEDNFEEIMTDETKEIIADGAYSSKEVQEKLLEEGKNIITTAIRGRKPDSDKLSSTDFEITDNRIIRCPHGMVPAEQEYKDGKIIAKFLHESCANCLLNCGIRQNKHKLHVLEISKEKIIMDIQRAKYGDKDYLRKCRLRPAVEGTIFQMKLHLRNGKSKYRGKSRVRFSMIARAIAINYKRVHAYRLKIATFFYIFKYIRSLKIFLNFKQRFFLYSA